MKKIGLNVRTKPYFYKSIDELIAIVLQKSDAIKKLGIEKRSTNHTYKLFCENSEFEVEELKKEIKSLKKKLLLK